MQRISIVDLFILSAILFVQLFNSAVPANAANTTRVPCPLVKCVGGCPYKYVIDKNGCQTCECNPCRFGQPLSSFPCGRGQGQCSNDRGLCKVSKSDNAYCCPGERSGCCPQGPNSAVALCAPAKCKTDFNCSVGQKCCGPCFTCVNATDY